MSGRHRFQDHGYEIRCGMIKIRPLWGSQQCARTPGLLPHCCDEGAGIPRMWIHGSGNATVVGRLTLRKTMCMNAAAGEVTEGESVLTAANGDEIHLTLHGQALPDPEPPTIDFVYVIDGGTGRFLHAVGALETRTILTSESTWINSGGGWIIYDASDRSGR